MNPETVVPAVVGGSGQGVAPISSGSAQGVAPISSGSAQGVGGSQVGLPIQSGNASQVAWNHLFELDSTVDARAMMAGGRSVLLTLVKIINGGVTQQDVDVMRINNTLSKYLPLWSLLIDNYDFDAKDLQARLEDIYQTLPNRSTSSKLPIANKSQHWWNERKMVMEAILKGIPSTVSAGSSGNPTVDKFLDNWPHQVADYGVAPLSVTEPKGKKKGAINQYGNPLLIEGEYAYEVSKAVQGWIRNYEMMVFDDAAHPVPPMPTLAGNLFKSNYNGACENFITAIRARCLAVRAVRVNGTEATCSSYANPGDVALCVWLRSNVPQFKHLSWAPVVKIYGEITFEKSPLHLFSLPLASKSTFCLVSDHSKGNFSPRMFDTFVHLKFLFYNGQIARSNPMDQIMLDIKKELGSFDYLADALQVIETTYGIDMLVHYSTWCEACIFAGLLSTRWTFGKYPFDSAIGRVGPGKTPTEVLDDPLMRGKKQVP